MSDIPVGSPPVPPGRHAAPSGWYADPLDPGQERYWDGWQWSRTTRQREGGAPAAGLPPYAVAPAPYPPAAGPGFPPQPGPPYSSPGPWPGYPAAGRPGQATATADGVPLAGWWWRILAVLLDAVLLFVVTLVAGLPWLLPMARRFSVLFADTLEAAEQGRPTPLPDYAALFPLRDRLAVGAVGFVLALAYHVLFLRLRAATPGKLVCGLRVVPVDQGRGAARLSWRTAVVRSVVWLVPNLQNLVPLPALALLFPAFRLLDALFPLGQPRRQAVHDLAAHTQVVKPLTSPAPTSPAPA